MSLLGDIFENVLSGDEDDIENVITDGAEYDEGDKDEQNEAENEEESTAKRVEPKKKVVRNPKPKLDPDRLRGPRGLATLEPLFEKFKYRGKGHEEEDLNLMMRRLEHWCHRLYPKFQFDDCLERLEKLGSKKVVQTYVKKIRLGMVEADENQEMSPDLIHDEDDLDDDSAQGSVPQNKTPPQAPPSLTEEEIDRIERNRLEAQRRFREKLNARMLAEASQNNEGQQ